MHDLERPQTVQPEPSRSRDQDENMYRIQSIDNDDEDQNEPIIKQNLRDWAVTHQITGTALHDLLKILMPVVPYLPKDPRTLLKTPTQYNIVRIGGG